MVGPENELLPSIHLSAATTSSDVYMPTNVPPVHPYVLVNRLSLRLVFRRASLVWDKANGT
jgi:hypothetical protein